MVVKFTNEQIRVTLNWIAKCARTDFNSGCSIVRPTMMQHPEFPEFLFLKYTKLQQEDGDITRTVHYTLVDPDGEMTSMSDKWDDKMVRMGVIADLLEFRLNNGKIEFV